MSSGCQTKNIWDMKSGYCMTKIFGMYDMLTLPKLWDTELCDVSYSVIFHIVAFQAMAKSHG